VKCWVYGGERIPEKNTVKMVAAPAAL